VYVVYVVYVCREWDTEASLAVVYPTFNVHPTYTPTYTFAFYLIRFVREYERDRLSDAARCNVHNIHTAARLCRSTTHAVYISVYVRSCRDAQLGR
jgi:hypothetical protein